MAKAKRSNKQSKQSQSQPLSPVETSEPFTGTTATPSTSIAAPTTPTPTPTIPTIPANPPSRYIVDTLFPQHRLHIIGGPAHAGKTMLLFHLMESWASGHPIFGYPSHPAPFCYVATNHALTDCQDAYRCSGATVRVPMVSLVDMGGPKNFRRVYEEAERAVPGVEVIFLDGILYICGSAGMDNATVGDFLSDTLREMRDRSITVIATGRCAKPKAEARNSIRSIDRLLGATAWTEFGSTFIAIEPKNTSARCDRRVITVMPKRAASFNLHYRFSGEGKLVEVSEDTSADSPDRLQEIASIVTVRDPGEEFTTAELLDIGREIGIISRSSMMGYLQILVRQGVLADGGHGRYVVPMVVIQ